MRFPSPAEVQEMRKRGYDPSVLVVEEGRCQAAEAVRQAICLAFANLTLGKHAALVA